jgi:hypothetical protein
MECLLDPARRSSTNAIETWSSIEKFFGYLESNGEEFWQAPSFKLLKGPRNGSSRDTVLESNLDDDPQEHPFGAAYDGFSYIDTTDDGVEGPVYQNDNGSDEEFIAESKRIGEHLLFLSGLAHM